MHKYSEGIGEIGDAGATSQYYYLSEKDSDNVFYPSVLRYCINHFNKYQTVSLLNRYAPSGGYLFLFKYKKPLSYIKLPIELHEHEPLTLYLMQYAPFFFKEKYVFVFSKYVLNPRITT